MLKVVSTVLLTFLISSSSISQSRNLIFGIQTDVTPVFEGMYGINALMALSERNQTGIEINFNPGIESYPSYKFPRWRIGLVNEYAIKRSKKHSERQSFYLFQKINYGKMNDYSVWESNDGQLRLRSKEQNLGLGLGLGKQFNLNPTFAINFKIGYEQSIWNKFKSETKNLFSESVFDPSRSGLTLGLELRYSFVRKKFESKK